MCAAMIWQSREINCKKVIEMELSWGEVVECELVVEGNCRVRDGFRGEF
jgi:hypothetical protein